MKSPIHAHSLDTGRYVHDILAVVANGVDIKGNIRDLLSGYRVILGSHQPRRFYDVMGVLRALELIPLGISTTHKSRHVLTDCATDVFKYILDNEGPYIVTTIAPLVGYMARRLYDVFGVLLSLRVLTHQPKVGYILDWGNSEHARHLTSRFGIPQYQVYVPNPKPKKKTKKKVTCRNTQVTVTARRPQVKGTVRRTRVEIPVVEVQAAVYAITGSPPRVDWGTTHVITVENPPAVDMQIPVVEVQAAVYAIAGSPPESPVDTRIMWGWDTTPVMMKVENPPAVDMNQPMCGQDVFSSRDCWVTEPQALSTVDLEDIYNRSDDTELGSSSLQSECAWYSTCNYSDMPELWDCLTV